MREHSERKDQGCKTFHIKMKSLGIAVLICAGLILGQAIEIRGAEAGAAGSEAAPTAVSDNSSPSTEYQRCYLSLGLPKTRLYLGEQIPVTITLYITELQVGEVDYPQLNQKEFAFGTIRRPSQFTQTIDGHVYRVVQFNTTMIPLFTGDLVLNPITVNCKIGQAYAVKMADGRVYHRMIQRNLGVTSSKIRLRVVPLPGGQPVDFSGGVGKFRLTVGRDTQKLIRQGEPFQVKLIVTGSGNLTALKAPYLEKTSGIESFPAKREKSSRTDRAVFESTLVVQDAKLRKLGPFRLTYFDPDSGKYRTAAASLPVTVIANPAQSGEANAKSGLKVDPPLKLAPLKESPAGLIDSPFLLLEQVWFWLIQLVPVLLLVICLCYRNYQQMLRSDLPQSRAIKAAARAGKRMTDAKALLDEGKYGQFLEELHFILREYLSERFNLAASGMTGAICGVVAEREPDLPTQALEGIRTFFDECDRYRFTGTELRHQDALRLWEIVNSVIVTINRVPAVPSKRNCKKTAAVSGIKGGSNHA